MDRLHALYTDYHHILFNPDRIPLAMAGVLLVAIVGIVTGPVMGNANPLVWGVLDKLLGRFGARLDRVNRPAGDLILRGFFLTIIGLLLVSYAGRQAQRGVVLYPYGGVPEIILLSLCLSAGSVWFALRRLYRALHNKQVGKRAYLTIAVSTRNDLSGSDDFTITRTGMAYAARAFDKGIVAPVLWYLIGGLPLAYFYAGVAGLAWRFGRDGFTRGFGVIPLGLEKLMGFVPGLLSGVLMAAAGTLTPTGGVIRGFSGLFRRNGRAPYAEGGVAVTAMANALKVGLGGPATDLDGRVLQKAWAGPEGATAKLDAAHLRRALYISVMAHLLFLALLGATLMAAPSARYDIKIEFKAMREKLL